MPIPLLVPHEILPLALQHEQRLRPLAPLRVPDLADLQGRSLARWRGMELVTLDLDREVASQLQRVATLLTAAMPDWDSPRELDELRTAVLPCLQIFRWVSTEPTTWACINAAARRDGVLAGLARVRLDHAIADGLITRRIARRITYYHCD